LDPAQRITLDELRQRILFCNQFTTPPASAAPKFVSNAYSVEVKPLCSEPLSPTSTISDEGSMVSDSSDNSDDSTVPSEIDPDYLEVEILDSPDAESDSNYSEHVDKAEASKHVDVLNVFPSNQSQVPCQNPYVSAIESKGVAFVHQENSGGEAIVFQDSAWVLPQLSPQSPDLNAKIHGFAQTSSQLRPQAPIRRPYPRRLCQRVRQANPSEGCGWSRPFLQV